MTHRTETTGFSFDVIGDRHPALDILTERFGTYRRKQGRYIFPKNVEVEVREILASITPAAAANPMNPGWSKAAQRRAGTYRSHPLGDVAYRGDGFTEYHDGLRGTGTVQIWDES